MPTLVMTINGPFAYVEDKHPGRCITIMAPMCPQHLAAISCIDADGQYVLQEFNCRNHPGNFGNCKAHKYELRFNPGKVESPTWIGNFLPCPKPSKPLNLKEWRFALKLPKPTNLVEINPVKAQIIGPKGQNKSKGSFAVGARFIYKNWDGGPLQLFYSNKPVFDSNNKPVCFKFKKYLKQVDGHGLLEIEYSNPLRDDPDHEDAVDCFENLMTALKLPWTIYIPKVVPPLGVGILSSKLNDCKAAVARVV
jgi:hypothetical protein